MKQNHRNEVIDERSYETESMMRRQRSRRMNHTHKIRQNSKGILIKTALFIIILIVAFVLVRQYLNNLPSGG